MTKAMESVLNREKKKRKTRRTIVTSKRMGTAKAKTSTTTSQARPSEAMKELPSIKTVATQTASSKIQKAQVRTTTKSLKSKSSPRKSVWKRN